MEEEVVVVVKKACLAIMEMPQGMEESECHLFIPLMAGEVAAITEVMGEKIARRVALVALVGGEEVAFMGVLVALVGEEVVVVLVWLIVEMEASVEEVVVHFLALLADLEVSVVVAAALMAVAVLVVEREMQFKVQAVGEQQWVVVFLLLTEDRLRLVVLFWAAG